MKAAPVATARPVECIVLAFPPDPVDAHCACVPLNIALSLHVLGSVSQNMLGPEGGAALAEGLKGNSSLKTLE